MRRAIAITTAERYFGLITNFATIAAVSRILSPAEIGISVIGLAIAGLALALREFATTNFVIQKKDLKIEDVRTSFTVLLLVTSAIAAVMCTGALPLSDFYDQRSLEPLIRVLALCLLAGVVFEPVAALLRRKMEFQRLAVLNVTASAVNAATTIGLAFLGFSYMSFGWGWLTSACVVGVMSVVVCDDRSIFRPCLKSWREFVAFGGYHGANILFYRLYDSLPYLVLGRTLSLHAVALYSRGITICQLPDKVLLGGVASVMLTSCSAEVRNGGDLRTSYLRAIEMITALQWPGLVLTAILAHPIVTLLLGAQWVEVVPLVQIMALASLFMFSAELNYPMLVAFGAMRDVLLRSIIVWPLSALIIAAASFYGLETAALAWLVTMPLQAYVSIYFIRRHVQVTWGEIAGALWRGGMLALLSAVGPISVVLYMGTFDLPIPGAVIAVLLAAIGWCAGLLLTAHPLREEVGRVVSVLNGVVPLARPALPNQRAAKAVRCTQLLVATDPRQ